MLETEKSKTTATKAAIAQNAPSGMVFDYADAPESTDVVKIKKRYELFIDGKYVKPKSGKYLQTINPATEEVISEVAHANEVDVDLAVKAARKAYTNVWSKLSGTERGRYLYRVARIIQERAREFAVLESIDNGKPIKESRDVDIPLVSAHFFYYAGWADKLEYAYPGKEVSSLGVAAASYSLEFPIINGRLENSSCVSYRKYRCSKAC